MFFTSEVNLRPTDSTRTGPIRSQEPIMAVLDSFQLLVQSTRVLVVLRMMLIVSEQISLIWCGSLKHSGF